jgi:hypothetical protein
MICSYVKKIFIIITISDTQNNDELIFLSWGGKEHLKKKYQESFYRVWTLALVVMPQSVFIFVFPVQSQSRMQSFLTSVVII